MNRIITVGREFGSGGRELGRRLAEALGYEYYDREIIEQIAEKTSFSEEYIHQVVEGRSHRLYPITTNHTFNFAAEHHAKIMQSVYRAQSDILCSMADKSPCVIVGRCADFILRERAPYRIFVYADMESRVRRCVERSEGSEHFSEKEIRRHIRAVDRNRSRYYFDHTGQIWGDKLNYDLCVNTAGREIKAMIPHITKML